MERSNHRGAQVSEALAHAAAQYLSREAGRETLLTVTRAELSADGKRATIFISVFPDTEGAHALVFLKRHEQPFREYLRDHARLRGIPHAQFALDAGEANRQRLEELSKDL
jgi:ribosome-binding factor A